MSSETENSRNIQRKMALITNTIIVGAGPAGLTLALLLAKAGIQVRLLERASKPTEETRAVFYNAVSQHEFKRAGVYDDIMKQGFVTNRVAFRDLTGKRLFEMPGGGQIALLQKDLVALISKKFQEQKGSGAEILWNYDVVDLGQDESKAWVDVETPQGRKRLEADYIVGCDGGSSAIRRGLFGQDAMPGFTWDKQLVAADVGSSICACDCKGG